jgi:hypothetical protein
MNKQLLAQVKLGYYEDNLVDFRFMDSDLLVGDLVTRLLLFGIIGAGLFFFVRLIQAGFSYMTSQGDPGKIQSASKLIINSAIGMALVLCTFFIAQMLELLFDIKII